MASLGVSNEETCPSVGGMITPLRFKLEKPSAFAFEICSVFMDFRCVIEYPKNSEGSLMVTEKGHHHSTDIAVCLMNWILTSAFCIKTHLCSYNKFCNSLSSCDCWAFQA